jgi:hypothetical protein
MNLNQAKKIFYFTDNVDKFDNNITNKENIIEVNNPTQFDWVKEIIINNNADLITHKTGNQNFLNCFRIDDLNSPKFVDLTRVGGSILTTDDLGEFGDLPYSLIAIDTATAPGMGVADYTFVKCCILD